MHVVVFVLKNSNFLKPFYVIGSCFRALAVLKKKYINDYVIIMFFYLKNIFTLSSEEGKS